MARKADTVERTIARLASAQHGVVTRRELLRAGISSDEISHRLAIGSLIRQHRGVYLVGHRAPNLRARYIAAVRAGGTGAVLSGLAAGHLLGLTKRQPPPEITAASARQVCGVKTRRARRIDARDRAAVDGIPVTSVPRTLVDLAAVLDPDALARACHEAQVRYRTTAEQVEAVLARRPNSRGAAELRRILRGDTRVTLSVLERAFLERLSQAGLPLPDTNTEVDGRRVDCRWPAHRLTVELDGYRFHHSRYAWERDRRREREARVRGDEFRRFSFGDVVDEPGHMLGELRKLLRRRS